MLSKNAKRFRETIARDLHRFGEEIYRSDNFKASDKNLQHGEVSVKKHSEKVAFTSLWLARKLKLKVQEKELVRGALLHDYFLYDWHDEEHAGFKNLHGFKHPAVALKNASAEYALTDREADIIKKHMWPLTLVPPAYAEGWLVTLSDKIVSSKESIHFIKMRKKYIELKKERKQQKEECAR